jgi:hypothetical protein
MEFNTLDDLINHYKTETFISPSKADSDSTMNVISEALSRRLINERTKNTYYLTELGLNIRDSNQSFKKYMEDQNKVNVPFQINNSFNGANSHFSYQSNYKNAFNKIEKNNGSDAAKILETLKSIIEQSESDEAKLGFSEVIKQIESNEPSKFTMTSLFNTIGGLINNPLFVELGHKLIEHII